MLQEGIQEVSLLKRCRSKSQPYCQGNPPNWDQGIEGRGSSYPKKMKLIWKLTHLTISYLRGSKWPVTTDPRKAPPFSPKSLSPRGPSPNMMDSQRTFTQQDGRPKDHGPKVFYPKDHDPKVFYPKDHDPKAFYPKDHDPKVFYPKDHGQRVYDPRVSRPKRLLPKRSFTRKGLI